MPDLVSSSEELYRILVRNFPNGAVFLFDRDLRLRIADGTTLKLYGFAPEKLEGQIISEVFPAEQAMFLIEKYRAVLEGKEFNEEMTVAGRTYFNQFQPVRDGQGQIYAGVIVSYDISERKQIEENLRLSEERYRSVSMLTSDYVWAATFLPDGPPQLDWSTGALETITGYTQLEIDGLGGWPAILHPDHLPELAEGMTAIFKGEASVGEFKLIRKDKTLRWVRFYSQPRWDDTHQRVIGLIGATQDITDRKNAEVALKKSEEELRQAQKMEAIGRLAGGMAHDFNNLLTVIFGHTDLALQAIAPDSPLRDELIGIQQSGERAAQLIRQLLAFSRRQILQPSRLSLNSAVENMDTLLRRLIGEDVELIIRLDPTLKPVYADPGQVEQVVMNLVVNARDAMPRGGQILVETGTLSLDTAYPSQPATIPPGAYSVLTVSDTGSGMSSDTLAQIFEPFFTTKGVGAGTGLGLAMVYGIIKQSEGHISVYSEPDLGTTFKLYLPQAASAEPEILLATASHPPLAVHSGSETILVVEDELQVRELIAKVLTRCGYKVLQANGITEALKIYQQHSSTIGMVLTDIVMPGQSGQELVAQLKLMQPNLKILYMSGYSDRLAIYRGMLEPGVAFLQKPFTPETLLLKIREILNRPVS